MSITCGFYNSLNADRKYNSEQLSSIFDGLILDGVFASIGTCFVVTADSGLNVNVGIGRAWFNHTWTYNDAIMPMTAPVSEVLLDRIDALVLEVDSREAVRDNTIKWVSGTPSSTPVNPTLLSNNETHQYPLCYIYRAAESTEIVQADITNMVGTEETPFVSGILETVDLSILVSQWQAILDDFVSENTQEITAWRAQFDALHDDLEEALAATTSGAVQAHKTSHQVGGSDELKPNDIGAIPVTSKGAPSGIASLNSDSKVSAEQASSLTEVIATSRNLVVSDSGKSFLINGSAPITITITSAENTSFQDGTEIEFIRYGVGTVTFASDSGIDLVSIDSVKTIGNQYGCVALKKISTTTWLLCGDLG